jgi:hypothetical protein
VPCAREAREVAVVGHDVGAVLDRERGVARWTLPLRPPARLARSRLAGCFVGRHRVRQYGGVRADADEREQRDPGEADGLGSVERRIEPVPAALVPGARAVDGEEQDRASATLGEAPRDREVLEFRRELRRVREVDSDGPERTRRRVRASAGRARP